MAITFATAAADLGKLFGKFANINGFCGAQANTPAAAWGANGPVVQSQSTMYSEVLTRLEGAGLTSMLPTSRALPAFQGLDNALSSAKQACVQDAQSVLLLRVNNDVAQQNPTSIQLAMVEWIRQMQVAAASVKQCTVTSTVAAGASNTGNATVYATLYDKNGLLLEYSYAETMQIRCTVDQFNGGIAGSETLTITSPSQTSNTTSFLWPSGGGGVTYGSGLNGSATVVDPTQGNGSGSNLIGGGSSTVGAFKAWTGSTPTGWVVSVDATNVADGMTNNYSGVAHCLKFIGNTGGTNLNTTIYQNFANGGVTGGSSITLQPNTVYIFYIQVKADVVPAAGALQVSLTDGSGNVLNNNAGTANTITISISGLGNTNYNAFKGAFQTPTIMPTTARIQIKASTKITTSSNVFMDFAALSAPSQLYAGGPYLSVFRGSVDLIRWISPTIGDYWTNAIANNYGSSSPTVLSIQWMFQQFFGMAQMGLILPSVTGGAETISNSVIS